MTQVATMKVTCASKDQCPCRRNLFARTEPQAREGRAGGRLSRSESTIGGHKVTVEAVSAHTGDGCAAFPAAGAEARESEGVAAVDVARVQASVARMHTVT